MDGNENVRFIQHIKKYYRYCVYSAKAQLKSEVAGSYLNWIWWILNPLSFMLIYAFLFGYVFNSREPYFPLFIFIGLTLWDFFNRNLLYSVSCVKHNKGVLSKVYFPKYILLLVKQLVNGFKLLVSFGIILLMIGYFRVPLTWNVLYFFPIMLTLVLLSFGLSCVLLHIGVYVEDLSNVMNLALRFLFYATGVFYSIETRIPVWGPFLNRANPIAFLITSMRDCLLYSRTPDLALLGIWFVICLALSVFGIRLIYRSENSYVKAI